MSAVDLFVARANREEGDKPFPYNDRTGRRVTCQSLVDPETSGNLSIGRGINLEIGLDSEEDLWLLTYRATKVHNTLLAFAWYSSLDEVRQSGALDIGYNAGVHGLLHFPHMISALAAKDWLVAQAECHPQDPRLAARYKLIGNIFATGSESQ